LKPLSAKAVHTYLIQQILSFGFVPARDDVASQLEVTSSFAERQNWTVRTTMRRYTRLSNGFSRKVQNHAAAVALNYFAYNFIKIHRTLRMSPTMAAGVTDRLWDVSDLVAL
jgi:hypothetical protein